MVESQIVSQRGAKSGNETDPTFYHERCFFSGTYDLITVNGARLECI